MPRRRPTYANVASTLALILATGGVAWAAGLPKNSVGTKQLRANAVTAAKIKPGAIGPGRLAPGAVQPTHLAPATLDALAPAASWTIDSTIAQVTPIETTVGTIALPRAGRYFLQVELRTFPRSVNPGHNLSCAVTGLGDDTPRITNVAVPSEGVRMITFSGLPTASGAATGTLKCRQIVGPGDVSVGFRMTAIRVGAT